MIALLLAAQIAATTAPPAPPEPLVRFAPSTWTYKAPPSRSGAVRALPLKRCAYARRLETSVDAALLFRPEDRAATSFKRLADLPPATPCLAAGAER